MIGVLAIQGGFQEHEVILSRLGLPWKEVRSLADVHDLTGLIIPGGESTVLKLFLESSGLQTWLVERVKSDPHFCVLGTCAGLIVLAHYKLLNVDVERNAYGRQSASFMADLGAFRGHFIRAPKITRVGENVEVLATYDDEPVLVRQGSVWACSFHPELADDTRLHAAVFSC